jgi:flagellar hook-basal body complex protein FliE
MPSPISPIGISGSLPEIQLPGQSKSPGAFQSALQDAIKNVEGYRQSADKGVEALLSGEGEELHQVALAAQRAELAFELFLQVRNKVVQAYQEVMHMQM